MPNSPHSDVARTVTQTDVAGDPVASVQCVCGVTVDAVRDACGSYALLHPMPPCELYLKTDGPGAYLLQAMNLS
jgi:hypothetical protein